MHSEGITITVWLNWWVHFSLLMLLLWCVQMLNLIPRKRKINCHCYQESRYSACHYKLISTLNSLLFVKLLRKLKSLEWADRLNGLISTSKDFISRFMDLYMKQIVHERMNAQNWFLCLNGQEWLQGCILAVTKTAVCLNLKQYKIKKKKNNSVQFYLRLLILSNLIGGSCRDIHIS